MSPRPPRTALAAALLFVIGCGAEGADDALESHTLALNACEETVPANRHIDGLPAYAQCSAFQNGPIYSNNGIDTSATKVGNDWVQTQGSGGYQCTELVHRYWLFKWSSKWLPRGNAGTWCDTQPPASSGVVQTTTPVHGDAMVLAPGSCGAAAGTGHVALVDVVDNARVLVIEQNPARRGTYQPSCARCFLHLVANDGSQDGGMAKPAPAEAGAAPPRVDAGAPVRSDAGRDGRDSDAGATDTFVPPASAGDAGAGTPGPAAVGVDASTGGAASPASTPAGEAGVTAAGGDEDESEAGGCSLHRSVAEQDATWSLLALALALRWTRRRERHAA